LFQVPEFTNEYLVLFGSKEKIATMAPPKGKMFTAASPHRLWSIWKKVSDRGLVRGMLSTPPAGLPVLCVLTASPIPESMSCRSGCLLSARTSPPIWMTFRQAGELNAHVRKGEKGSLVVYANAITRTEHDEKTGGEVEHEIPYMKGYTVFNVEQIEGLPEIYCAKADPTRDPVARIDHAEKFFGSLSQRLDTAEIVLPTPRNTTPTLKSRSESRKLRSACFRPLPFTRSRLRAQLRFGSLSPKAQESLPSIRLHSGSYDCPAYH
jgi:N-terminal domain of anti-restriction factor ArdC